MNECYVSGKWKEKKRILVMHKGTDGSYTALYKGCNMFYPKRMFIKDELEATLSGNEVILLDVEKIMSFDKIYLVIKATEIFPVQLTDEAMMQMYNVMLDKFRPVKEKGIERLTVIDNTYLFTVQKMYEPNRWRYMCWVNKDWHVQYVRADSLLDIIRAV